MSDPFADLWKPLPAKRKPQTLSAAAVVAPSPPPPVPSQAWAGLDSLETGIRHMGTNANVNRNTNGSKQANLVNIDDDNDWGLGDFGSVARPPSTSRSSGPAGDLLLLDDDDDHDHLMGGIGRVDEDDEEDILGVLSKPVEVVIAKKNSEFGSSRASTTTHSRPTPPPPAGRGPLISGPPSPPPHILGQLVEMGFSISQAKNALAATADGKDVQTALESLLSGSGGNRGGDVLESFPTQAAQVRPTRPPPPNPNVGPTDIQDQADKLLLQASEIGLNVLSRASAFWKEGKEKVVKVMEDRGRPSQPLTRTHSLPPPRSLTPPRSRIPSRPRTPPRLHTPPRPRTPPRSRTLPTTSPSTLSLASTHKNTGTSKFKLGQYGPASESYTSAVTLLPPGHLLLVPLYTNRSLARLRCGEYVGAGEDAGEALKIICVFDSNANANLLSDNGNGNGNVIWNPDTEVPQLIQAGKERMNEGGWLDLRGVGIDLVDGYVKALRRRAEAWEGREKWVEAGRDWEVLAGGGGWIGEGVKKEAVRGAGRCRKMISASRQESVGSSSTSNLPLQKPKPKLSPRPPRPAPSSQPSKALLAHQATTLQAEADDTLKHQLKDSVDARISAWKNGKETNIRALLASLDMVLWDEILMKGGGGGVKVNGLGELVTDAQVKKGYVRAIARVHPDKLNTSNSTVEQRMLANSVFSALNDAWIAFQGGK